MPSSRPEALSRTLQGSRAQSQSLLLSSSSELKTLSMRKSARTQAFNLWQASLACSMLMHVGLQDESHPGSADFNRNKMNEVAEGLDDENPCK